MSACEIATVTRKYRERIIALLTPDEVAAYDAYEQRLQAQIDACNFEPTERMPVEQAVMRTVRAFQSLSLSKRER